MRRPAKLFIDEKAAKRGKDITRGAAGELAPEGH